MTLSYFSPISIQEKLLKSLAVERLALFGIRNFYAGKLGVRGFASLESDQASDEYYNSRSLRSRLGAWASLQSTPLASREVLLERVEKFRERFGQKPKRPEFWGGFRIVPAEIELWAEGESRLHDRFLWVKGDKASNWNVERLYP